MPDTIQERGGYVRAEDFFSSPQTTAIASDIQKQTLMERERTVLDLETVREQEDWSYLASQTVGAEAG